MTFHLLGIIIIPSDEVIFFRELGQPPSSIYIYILDIDITIKIINLDVHSDWLLVWNIFFHILGIIIPTD